MGWEERMAFIRRGFCGLVASVIAGTIGCSLASAQTANVRPLRFVVPCPEGSPADALARAFAQILSKDLERDVHVDNLPAPDISTASPDTELHREARSAVSSEATLGCGE